MYPEYDLNNSEAFFFEEKVSADPTKLNLLQNPLEAV